MSNRIHILFYCPFLNGGGAEMHLVRMMKSLDETRFEKTLVISRSGGSYEYLIRNTDINIIYLDINSESSFIRILKSIFPLVKSIKDINPDITFSLMDNVNVFVILSHRIARHKSKLVIGVQTSIKKSIEFSNSHFKRFILSLMKNLYKYADKIICLSNGVANELNQILINTQKKQYEVIHNIGFESEKNYKTQEKNKHQLCICGRLIPLKGFDLVIKAVAEVSKKYDDVSLVILGEGPEKEKLRSQCYNLNISNRVYFKGFVTNVAQVMAESEIFILSSYYEGFGNVIVESMGVGTPVIATDCPYGPADIITNGKNGFLVPIGNSNAISKSVIELFNNQNTYDQIRLLGYQKANDFTSSTISKQHEKLFDKILEK